MNGNSCKSISPLACSVRESHGGEREGRSRAGILYSIIAQYSYVLQPKVTLALFSRIPSFRKGKMRSRTNRLSILAFLHVSRRDISVWKWALKPACLIQLWFTIVSKMAAETKKPQPPNDINTSRLFERAILSCSAPTVAFSSPCRFQILFSLYSTSNIQKQTHT